MDNSASNIVKVLMIRTQDGETEEKEYEGNLKIINDKLHLSFSETSEDGAAAKHLLKIDRYGMEWVRLHEKTKSKTRFQAGKTLPFLFNTPHGTLNMELVTHEYTYTKKDTHEICVSYSINQDGAPVSQYRTTISII